MCKFTVATNRKWKTEAGEQKEETTFVDIDAYGKTAENIAKYFTKGRCIYVEGRLRLEQWDDKTTGQKRSKLGVVCENFQFVGKAETTSAPRAETRAVSTESPLSKAESDDVPFN